MWLGVEWDDTSRGKHSGDHQGVHYFSCRLDKKLMLHIQSPQIQGSLLLNPGSLSWGAWLCSGHWNIVIMLDVIISLFDWFSDLCFSREGSGSFVRPKKISLGCTFIEAIQEACCYYTSHVPSWCSFSLFFLL